LQLKDSEEAYQKVGELRLLTGKETKEYEDVKKGKSIAQKPDQDKTPVTDAQIKTWLGVSDLSDVEIKK
jgi:hypothetical protein